MGTNHGVAQVHIFDHRLQLAASAFLYAAAEDEGERVGLADGPIFHRGGALVRHACRLADTVGFAAVRSLETPSYQDVLEELSGRERKSFAQSPEEVRLKIATKINSME